jgi:hypothetical protein
MMRFTCVIMACKRPRTRQSLPELRSRIESSSLQIPTSGHFSRYNKKPNRRLFFSAGVQNAPERQLRLLFANLPPIQEALEKGSLVVIEQTRIRIRSLPIGGGEGI